MSVFPKNQNNVNDLELVDKHGNRWELKLNGDVRSMQEIPSSPSTMAISSGGQRYGDWEPGFSHVEQRSWIGGRGVENFDEDNTGYFDSQMAWTLTDGKAFPAPQYRFAEGLRNTDSYMPGSVKWVALRGTNLYLSTSFAASASYSADKARMWIRRRGSPGTLTFTLRSDNSGAPGTVLQTVTKTIADVTDTVSVLLEFDWTGTESLTASTTYWVCLQGGSADNATNHWEVGVDAATSSAKSSSDGSTWATAALKLYYRVLDADLARRFWFFSLEGALYAVSQYQDTTASKIYINGDRGTASSGSTSTLTNSSAVFGTASKFVGARVKIVSGTGNGQNREITAHTGTELTVSPAFKVAPDNTSRYVIYATKYWKELSEATGLGKVVNRPCVAGRQVFFPQGSGTNMRKMRINGNTHEFNDSGTDKADLVKLFYSGTTPKIWRAQNDLTDVTVSSASIPSWGSSSASFSSNVSVGSPDYLITNMLDYNNTLWVFKEDSIWLYNGAGFDKFTLAMGDSPSEKNGLAVATQDLVLYFTFLDSVEYTNGGNTTDFGPWLGSGLPSGRSGNISSIVPILAWSAHAIDGDTGTSSVLMMNDISGSFGGWHEILRGFGAGKRIQDISYQPNIGTRNRLWTDIGGDIIYQDFPLNTLNPLRDSGFNYQHECVIISQTHDLNFSDLPKFYKELVLVTERMASGMEICVDYQTDENVGTDNWIHSGSVYRSPKGSVLFNEGGRRKFRYRLRINTNNVNIAPVLEATILKAYARTPVKRQWNLKVKADKDITPRLGDLYKWLWNNCQEANGVIMHSDLEEIDGTWVIVEPPTVLRAFKDTLNALWGGTFVLTLREA